MKILITGASGFLGSFLCEGALRRGMETWAGMRSGSSRRWLQHEKLNFAFLDMTRKEVLGEQLRAYQKRVGKWDIVIHAAGATKCVRREDFDLNNFICTRNLIECLEEAGMMPSHFIYISSLSADNPDTAYGESKLKSENWLRDYYTPSSQAQHPSPTEGSSGLGASSAAIPSPTGGRAGLGALTIFRPTGIYGPREKDYYHMVKSVKRHIDIAVGFSPQKITFLFIDDMVSAVFKAIDKPDIADGKIYTLSDGETYSSRDFTDLIRKNLGNPYVLRLTVPLWILKSLCGIGDWISHLTGRPVLLNRDKYNILSKRDWTCSNADAMQDLDWHPEWNLERGVRSTINWYKENK